MSMTLAPPPVYAARFLKSCRIGTDELIHFKKDDIVFLDYVMAREVKEKGMADIYDGNELFSNFKPSTPKSTPLFVHIGGGIGDIIAFSGVAKYLKNYVIIAFTDPHYFCIWNQFASGNIACRHIFSQIVSGMDKTKTLRRIPIEGAAVLAGGKNWFEAYFDRLHLSPGPEFYRPELVTNIEPIKDKIYIAHRASCQIRSSRFKDFYLPAKRVLKGKKYFVNAYDLTLEDKRFIESQTCDVRIIQTGSAQEYLDNLASAELVISTDTGAIHYREAIRKPALAAFGAMTTESRTKYYKYTRSFDMKSPCPFQPCFTHELMKGATCEMTDNEVNPVTAPCIVGIEFQEQLERELLNYKY
jgi:hypothetical protein